MVTFVVWVTSGVIEGPPVGTTTITVRVDDDFEGTGVFEILEMSKELSVGITTLFTRVDEELDACEVFEVSGMIEDLPVGTTTIIVRVDEEVDAFEAFEVPGMIEEFFVGTITPPARVDEEFDAIEDGELRAFVELWVTMAVFEVLVTVTLRLLEVCFGAMSTIVPLAILDGEFDTREDVEDVDVLAVWDAPDAPGFPIVGMTVDGVDVKFVNEGQSKLPCADFDGVNETNEDFPVGIGVVKGDFVMPLYKDVRENGAIVLDEAFDASEVAMLLCVEFGNSTGPIEVFDKRIGVFNEENVESVERTRVLVGDEVFSDKEGIMPLCIEVSDATGLTEGLPMGVLVLGIVVEEFIATKDAMLLMEEVEDTKRIELSPVLQTAMLLVLDDNEDEEVSESSVVFSALDPVDGASESEGIPVEFATVDGLSNESEAEERVGVAEADGRTMVCRVDGIILELVSEE